MLVSFSFTRFSEFTPAMIVEFDESPYAAVSVPVISPYETGKLPALEDLRPQIIQFRTLTAKHIWPWVSLNRMVGANAAEKNAHAQVPYFLRIRGADLDNSAGARDDFYQAWRVGLQAAKALGSPGVVFDPEFYNDYAAYKIPELARQTGKTPHEVTQLLRNLGADMADIANEELPGAKVWTLFTGLSKPGWYTEGATSYYLSPAYVVMGFLERIKRSGYRLTVISGGEISLGYCSRSLEQMHMKIDNRFRAALPFLDDYAGILVLGGTTTLWLDEAHKKGYFAQGDCGMCSARNVEDLQPYLETLFRNYAYAWIWASGGGGYHAFDPRVTPRFNAAITNARSAAGRASKN